MSEGTLPDARETIAGRARYRDLALLLVSAKNPTETILKAGGRWDKFDERFVEDEQVDLRVPGCRSIAWNS